MYTITVKIAANGTIYHDTDTSVTGHMWYSISNGNSTESYGFAPAKDSMPIWEGTIKKDDDTNYGSTYYTGTIVINQWQYEQLQNFGKIKNLDGNPFDFSSFYIGTSNSCIDYTWKALNIIGLNPSDFEGQIWPTKNADNADEALYKYLMGDLSGWDSSQPNAGDYHVVYGSNGGDNLVSQNNTDALYGGRGDDSLYGNNLDNFLSGGDGSDTLVGGTGSDGLVGGIGNDTLIGTNGYGGDDGVSDTLNGGVGYDTYISGNNDVIYDADGSGMIVFEGRLLHGVDVTQDSTIYPSNQDHTAYYSKTDKGTYTRNGNSGFRFVSDSGKTLTVYSPLDYTEKVIPKPGGGTMTQKTYRGVGVILENFSSPLVLDLNHDGVTSLDLYATPAYFDMEGDGIREKTGWIQSTDALLALDKNRDGIINDGSELFGNNTLLKNGTKASNGFEALAQYDNNRDGTINTNDAIYHALSAWIDTDQDGVTDTGELHTLSELGVTSINLNATATTAYEDQNAITHTSTFTQQGTDADGNTITETKAVNDVWFRKDATNTLTTATLDAAIAALPHIAGSGQVKDLHGAMQERTALKTAVEEFMNSTATYTDQTAAIKNILALWSNTDDIDPNQARGEQYVLNHNYGNIQPAYRYRIYAYERDVAILERFAGTTFSMTTADGQTTRDVVDTQTAQAMTDRLNDLIDTTMIRLLGQKLMGETFYDTLGRPDYDAMFQTITAIMEGGTQSDKATSATLIAAIIHRDGFESLNRFDQSLLQDTEFKTLLQSNGVTYTINPDGTISGNYAGTVEGGSGNDTLSATLNGTVYGGDGNDTIHGSGAHPLGHDTLFGGDGNDTLYGYGGDDIIDGGDGDDVLYSSDPGRGWSASNGYGAYGHDVLIGGLGNDTMYGYVRNSTYVYVYGDGYDTIIDEGNTGFTPDILELRGIRFENIRVESAGNDMVIRIMDIADADKESGSVTIKNGMGNGKIENFVLDDTTLNFTTLQLSAQGVLNDDTYTYTIGEGRRVISDGGSIRGDTLCFGEGIDARNIRIKASSTNNDLTVAIQKDGKKFSDLNDRLTIANWFSADNRIETFVLADGTTWDVNAILSRQGTDENDTVRLVDENGGVTLDLGAGDDTIATGSGNDTLRGGAGNDTIRGGAGNDVYLYEKWDGADIILDASGKDVFSFGEGIGKNDLIFRQKGYDLIVMVKEEGKTAGELTDAITFTDWFSDNTVEQFGFADETTMSSAEIAARFVGVSVRDTLFSNRGAVMRGGANSDTYVYNQGDFTVVIDDVYMKDKIEIDAGHDTLVFASGVTKNDVTIGVSGTDLVIKINSATTNEALQDIVVIKDWKNPLRGIEEIVFSDGEILAIDKGAAYPAIDFGTAWTNNRYYIYGNDNDAAIGTDQDERFETGGGNDTVNTGGGNDRIDGGEGNDIIEGGVGNDTVAMGTGDDDVSDVSGDDVYVYAIGDGKDTIADKNGRDTLAFGDGIDKENLMIKLSGNDLIVGLKESETVFEDLKDIITIKNWLYGNHSMVFQFESGIVLNDSDIKSMIQNYGTENVLAFDGNSRVDFMDVATASQIKNSFSFGAWIKVSNPHQIDYQERYGYGGTYGQNYAFGPAWGSASPTSPGGFAGAGLSVGTNGISVYEHGGYFMPATAVYAAQIGDGFNHIMVVYKDKIPSIYLNGTLVHTGVSSAAANVFAPPTFGGMDYGYLNGLMDEIVIYNKPLNSDEIKTIMSGKVISDQLMAHYSFDGTQVYDDASGKEQTVIVSGEPVTSLLLPPAPPTIPEKGNINVIGQFTDYVVIDDGAGIDTIHVGPSVAINTIQVVWVQGTDDVYLSVKGDDANGLLLKDWYVCQNKVLIFADGTIWNTREILDAMGSQEDDVFNGLKEQSNVIHANGGNDAVSTFDYADSLYGEAGDDVLDSGGGNDRLIGGAGNDLLFGGKGDDTYVFDRGFGKDVVYDVTSAGTDGGYDRIVFGVDIAYSDLIVKSFEGDNNLYIALGENGTSYDELSDMITIKDWYVQNNRIETIILGNNTQISLLELLRARAADAGEAITALADGGELNGTEGGDTLIGNVGDDFIQGLGGNDTLLGGNGNDALIGGNGDDSLGGGLGDDAYFFGRGDGRDTVYDSATAIQEGYGYVVDAEGIKRWSRIEQEYAIEGGEDTLYFGDKILPDDLNVRNDGYDLVISLKNAPADTMRIQDYYKPFNSIEYFGFSNGTIMEKEKFESLLFTSEDDSVTFIDDQDHVLSGNGGNDVINGGSGNDTIDGGTGNDTLNGGFGNDVYRFGRGSGHDTIIDSGIGEWWQTGSGDDTVELKDGLTRSDLIVTVEGNDLVIGIKEGDKALGELSDTLRIVGAFNGANPFETIEFANGKETTSDTLLNQVPEAAPETFYTLQDTRILSGNVGATDGDGDTLSYSVTTSAAHGTLSVNDAGEWSYAANDGYMGIDTAIITVDDGNGGTATQTLSFDLRVSAPTLSDGTAGLLEDTSATGTFSVTNPIGGALTYEIVNGSAKGAFSVTETGEWSYAPSANLNGDDDVTIKVTNSYGLSTTATLSFAIEALNDAPVLIETPEPLTLYAGSSATGTLIATDVDGDALHYSVTTAPAHGTLSIDADGVWNYTAERYYAGESSATVTVDDGNGGNAVATLDFTNLMTPDWHYTYATEAMSINDGDGTDLLVMDTVSMGDMAFIQEGNNLRIDVKNQPDVILSDYFASVSKGVESVLTKEGIISLSKEFVGIASRTCTSVLGGMRDDLISGTLAADRMYGREGEDILFGQTGDDGLYGEIGNDLLIGGAGIDSLIGSDGDDTLYGDSGNDSLSGGIGNDRLIGGSGDDGIRGDKGNDLLFGGEGINNLLGGSGDDTYLFANELNATTIDDYAVSGYGNMYNWNTNGGYDTVKFGKEITRNDISFLMQSGNLLIQYGTGQNVTVRNQTIADNRIERFELSDGSYLSNSDVDRIVQQLTAYGKDHGFSLTHQEQIRQNQALMNIISSGWHQ